MGCHGEVDVVESDWHITSCSCGHGCEEDFVYEVMVMVMVILVHHEIGVVEGMDGK